MWLLVPVVFCAIAAVILIVLTAYNEVREPWVHPDRRPTDETQHRPRPR
jgi:hypothetical protein